MSANLSDVKKYFEEKLQEFGSNAKGMDWKNEESQYLRFEVISKYIDFASVPSVLDVGCGNGEFLNFCNKKGIAINYTGLDILPQMVSATNSRFGENTAICEDVRQLHESLVFDYVIASGTFNAKLDCDEVTWRSFFYENIKAMFSHASKGIVFNCMSHHVDYRYDRLFYVTDEELSNFMVQNFSRKYIIDHSYPLFEMTLAAYK